MTFLSPLLLSGLALASVPVIIHLLNRRRFIRIDWAPMEFLKLTIRKNRRRIQIEQWLLLAVRVLAVAALFFAVARPTISNNALAQLLAAQGRAARFIVIDDSLSMGAQSAGKSALSRAKEAAVELLKHVQPQDTVTVMTALQPETPLVRDAHLDQTDAVAALVKSLEVTQAFGQWGATFEKIDAHVQRSSQPVREVVLVTDLRAAGWDAGVADVVDRWAAGNVSLRIIDVGSGVAGNVVLKSLEQTVAHRTGSYARQLSGPHPQRRHRSTAAQEATLTVDGKPQSIQLPELPAKADVDLPDHGDVRFARHARDRAGASPRQPAGGQRSLRLRRCPQLTGHRGRRRRARSPAVRERDRLPRAGLFGGPGAVADHADDRLAMGLQSAPRAGRAGVGQRRLDQRAAGGRALRAGRGRVGTHDLPGRAGRSDRL